jgi:hypothetical protein
MVATSDEMAAAVVVASAEDWVGVGVDEVNVGILSDDVVVIDDTRVESDTGEESVDAAVKVSREDDVCKVDSVVGSAVVEACSSVEGKVVETAAEADY